MIRQDKGHILFPAEQILKILWTVNSSSYKKKNSNYRDLTPQEERDLLDNHFNKLLILVFRRSIQEDYVLLLYDIGIIQIQKRTLFSARIYVPND
jgi:hypothetical protein